MADWGPFFQVIPAMGKTSFRIIFLPTEEGSIESSLFINTSSYGVLSYHVSNFFLLSYNLVGDLTVGVGIFLKRLGNVVTWFMSLKYKTVSDVKIISVHPFLPDVPQLAVFPTDNTAVALLWIFGAY